MIPSLTFNGKSALTLFGDIVIYYGSLFLMLLIRYGNNYHSYIYEHLGAFSILLLVWIIIFYINGLFSYKLLQNTLTTARAFGISIIISIFVSISLFYSALNYITLAPKTNLFIFSAIFAAIDFSWRFFLNRKFGSTSARKNILFVGNSKLIPELVFHIQQHPQIGYTTFYCTTLDSKALVAFVKEHSIETIVLDDESKQNTNVQKAVYELISTHIDIVDTVTLYETFFGKIPLEEIRESWFIETVRSQKKWYEFCKRITDIFFAIVLFVVLSPLFFIIGILVVSTSRGPIIYSQKRIGRDTKIFTLFKFRNMYHSTERNPDAQGTAPVWWQENDPRVTPIGKILRKTHLDELPQLINILRGDMSFVGPRPERPHFVDIIQPKVPHYEIRHLITPGVTGWAQVTYQYTSSIEDSAEKLKYDIYYLKNRSFVLDLLIIIKTIRTLL